MKIWGETIFDIVYLLFAIISGIIILKKPKNDFQKLMGFSVLTLGIGDAFHLVPRILSYFVNADFNMYLGIGKLVTSITMTIFYILIYHVYIKQEKITENKLITKLVYVLSIIRIALCLLPQNQWTTNDGSISIGIIRNIPFVILGITIIVLYFKDRNNIEKMKNIWCYILFSFMFYIPVVIGAGVYPILGMFMLPKTICYMLIIGVFNKMLKEN